MKIVAIIDYEITSGGGFNQALNAIRQITALQGPCFDLEVWTNYIDNIQYLNKIGCKSNVFKYTFLDRIVGRLTGKDWWYIVSKRLNFLGNLERKLVYSGCSLVYFVTPSSIPLSFQRLNFIYTVWDLCHFEMCEFPEVRDNGEYWIRDRLYERVLPAACLIITDSTQLSNLAAHRYRVSMERFLPIPFSGSLFLRDEGKKENVLNKYNLTAGYYYYPAQFWSHKNHIRVIEAVEILKNNKINVVVVFSGKDYGAMDYIKAEVKKRGLNNLIKFLGFVSEDELMPLYKAALAVVMPTYFGPTNLPPFEAWIVEKPLIYNIHFREQAGDAALYVDPDSSSEIAKAMLDCMDPEIVDRLIKAGRIRIKEFDDKRKDAEHRLISAIERYCKRQSCWESI